MRPELITVLCHISEHGYSISSLVEDVLASHTRDLRYQAVQSAKDHLEREAVNICAYLVNHVPTSASVSAWALQNTQLVLRRETEELTKKDHGLRFHASAATVEQVESSFMPHLAGKIRHVAPTLWAFVFTLLGTLDKRDPCRAVDPMDINLSEVFDESERNLGELGEDTPAGETEGDDGTDSDSDLEDNLRHRRKRVRKDASARNTALRKTVVCASIILKSANKNCNHLQSVMGIFVHSANVPQRVIEVLAHAGLSISIKSIQRAVKSMSNDSAHKIKESLRTLKVAIAYDNFDINFKTSKPTLTHQSSFVSATSATAIPLACVEDIKVLRCSEELWKKDPRNPSPLATPVVFDDFDLAKYHLTDRYNQPSPGRDVSPQQEAFAWHVREILVNHGQYFGNLSKRLGTIDSILTIPLTKTEQIPMRSMKIKQSSVDGNIEVMDNLLQQGGLGDATDP
ncbi:hypothetical protein EDB89DRAFT_1848802, partial [Lactarius sanguifluus]